MISDISHSYTRDRKHGNRFSFGLTQPLVVVRHPVRPFAASSASVRARRGATVRSSRVHLGMLPAWMALFAVLNAGDLISTYIGLHSGLREGNPLMDGLLMHYGFAALIVYKMLVVAAVGLGVVMLRRFHRGIASATIWICNALVLVVVLLNVLQFATR